MVIYVLRCDSKQPDWEAAEKAIRNSSLQPADQDALRADLEELQFEIEQGGRDLAKLHDEKGTPFYATGGSTWGEAPNELIEVIHRLAVDTDVLAAASLKLIA